MPFPDQEPEVSPAKKRRQRKTSEEPTNKRRRTTGCSSSSYGRGSHRSMGNNGKYLIVNRCKVGFRNDFVPVQISLTDNI